MDVGEKLVELLNNSFSKQYEKRGLLTAPHTATDLIANGVTVHESDGCEHCRAASYTENQFTVITQMGREVKTQFNFCPNCGRRLQQLPKDGLV